MIAFAQQDLGQTFLELARFKATFYFSSVADRNVSCLFRYDDRNSVRFFCDAKSSPMPKSQSAVEVLSLTDWENASSGNDSIVPNNHATIVKGCFRKKNRYQKLLRHVAIN